MLGVKGKGERLGKRRGRVISSNLDVKRQESQVGRCGAQGSIMGAEGTQGWRGSFNH